MLVLSLLLAASGSNAQTSFGKLRPLTDGWRFVLADDKNAAQTTFDDSRWRAVSLPHDWGVTLPMSPDAGSCQGYLPGGIGWYRCHFTPRQDEVADGRKLYIFFEGVYNRSTVYLNGHELGYRPSGFASFLYDLTPHIQPGADNVLAVRVDHSRQNDARWYTGSGINRPVWLVSAPKVHLALWGSAWRVKTLDNKKAVVEIDVETTNDGATDNSPRKAIVEVKDADGRIVATKQTTIGTAEKKTLTLNINNPKKWELDTPYLYKVVTRLMAGNQETDRAEVPMGLRTLTFSADKGFALNGRWMKVKGVCVHDDAGVLGTAVPADVWRTRLLTLKSLGTNAIRMSHNPHAPVVYDLCDELGLLVMDEASDEWEFPKRKWLKGWNQGTPGYEGTFDYFEEWIDRDVADMVRRDRCHPSIFLWSIGNEVDYPNDPYTHPVLNGNNADFTQPAYGGYKPDQPNAERIGKIAQRLSAVVRSIDNSRAVTGALAGVVMSNQTAYPEAVDVVGYNYTESRYQEDHKRYPKRVIYGSENRHDLAAWKAVRDNEHIFGQFLWTGIDYLGESGAWPARGSEAGLLNLAGMVKPNGHYRAALWSEKPVCYIGTYPNMGNGQRNNNRSGNRNGRNNRNGGNWISTSASPSWNYTEGQSVRVVCYTNMPDARLLMNGHVVGGKPQRDEATTVLYWDIEYAPGTLCCEALDGDKVVAAYDIATYGRPYALRATADKSVLSRPDEVAQVIVEVVDEEGHWVPMSDNEVTCMSMGVRLLGMENGDARNTMATQAGNRLRVRQGRLVAYLAPGRMHGQQTVTFSSPWLQPAEVSLNIDVPE